MSICMILVVLGEVAFCSGVEQIILKEVLAIAIASTSPQRSVRADLKWAALEMPSSLVMFRYFPIM